MFAFLDRYRLSTFATLSMVVHVLLVSGWILIHQEQSEAKHETNVAISVITNSGQKTPTATAQGEFKESGSTPIANGAKQVGSTGLIVSDIVSEQNGLMLAGIEYPYLAQKYEWQGTVVVEVHITDSIISVKVIKTSNHLVLDQTAVNAAKSWPYPALLLNQKFPLTFDFQLNKI